MSDRGHDAAIEALDDIPYVECPECQGLASWIAPNTGNVVLCGDCDGRGTVPPNNAALVAAYFAARGWPDPAELTLEREVEEEPVYGIGIRYGERWVSPFRECRPEVTE